MSGRISAVVERALADVARGMTVYAAAKAHGVAQSTLHRQLARSDTRPRCPACGQVKR